MGLTGAIMSPCFAPNLLHLLHLPIPARTLSYLRISLFCRVFFWNLMKVLGFLWDLKSLEGDFIPVQVRARAPRNSMTYEIITAEPTLHHRIRHSRAIVTVKNGPSMATFRKRLGPGGSAGGLAGPDHQDGISSPIPDVQLGDGGRRRSGGRFYCAGRRCPHCRRSRGILAPTRPADVLAQRYAVGNWYDRDCVHFRGDIGLFCRAGRQRATAQCVPVDVSAAPPTRAGASNRRRLTSYPPPPVRRHGRRFPRIAPGPPFL